MPAEIASDEFRLGRSARLAALLLIVAGGGMAATLASGAPWWLVAACVLAIAHPGLAEWRLQVSRTHRRAVVALGRDVAGEWWVSTRGGVTVTVRIQQVWVHPRLVVLHCRGPAGVHDVVVLPDATGTDAFRRLCAALRTDPMADIEQSDSSWHTGTR